MTRLFRGVVIAAMLACAGCVLDPGIFGGGSYPYPGQGYPVGGDPPYPGDGAVYGAPFRCESRDDRTRRCPADTRGGVRMTRQLSNTPCIRGRTWDADRNGVWVTEGCRAEFIAGQGSGGGYPVGGGSDRVRCESDDMRTRRCPVDTRGGVRLVRQLSSTACIEGRTWGHDANQVWVTGGCRGEFATGGGGGHRPNPGPGPAQILRCESKDGRQRRCNATIRRQATLVRQLSNSPCIRGSSWGWDANGIWVGSGCRAEFSIR